MDIITKNFIVGYNIGVWYFRGGNFKGGGEAGMFSFASHQGHYEDIISFRLILTPMN